MRGVTAGEQALLYPGLASMSLHTHSPSLFTVEEWSSLLLNCTPWGKPPSPSSTPRAEGIQCFAHAEKKK